MNALALFPAATPATPKPAAPQGPVPPGQSAVKPTPKPDAETPAFGKKPQATPQPDPASPQDEGEMLASFGMEQVEPLSDADWADALKAGPQLKTLEAAALPVVAPVLDGPLKDIRVLPATTLPGEPMPGGPGVIDSPMPVVSPMPTAPPTDTPTPLPGGPLVPDAPAVPTPTAPVGPAPVVVTPLPGDLPAGGVPEVVVTPYDNASFAAPPTDRIAPAQVAPAPQAGPEPVVAVLDDARPATPMTQFAAAPAAPPAEPSTVNLPPQPKAMAPEVAVQVPPPDAPADAEVMLPKQPAPAATPTTTAMPAADPLAALDLPKADAAPARPQPAMPQQHTPQTAERFVSDNADKLVRHVRAQTFQSGGEMQVRLDPPSLGSVAVRVRVAGGVAEVSFTTPSGETAQLLGKSLHTLKAGLEAAGVTVDRLQVRQAAPEQSAAQQQDRGDDRQQQQQREQQQTDRDRRQGDRGWSRYFGAADEDV